MRILLIGGNPGEIIHLRELLSGIHDIDFQWEAVSSLSDGIGRCKNETFDIIICNLTLPDSAGLQTFRSMFAVSGNTPVVVVTTKNDENSGIEAVKTGAADYLVSEELNKGLLKHIMLNAVYRNQFLQKLSSGKFTPEPKPNASDIEENLAVPRLKFHDSSVKIEQPVRQFNLLQELIDNIPNPIFYKNKDLIYTGCNKAFEDFIGQPAEKIIGSSVLEISPLELAVVYHDADAKLLKQRGKQIYESQVRASDGSLRDVIFNKSVYFDANGKPDGIVGLIIDITDKKKALDKCKTESEISKGIAELTQHLLQPGKSLDSVSALILQYAQKFTGATIGYAGTIDTETGELMVHSFSDKPPQSFHVDIFKQLIEKQESKHPQLSQYYTNTGKSFYSNNPVESRTIDGISDENRKIVNLLSMPTFCEGKPVGQITLANTENGFTDEDLHHIERLSHIFAIAIQKHHYIQDLMMAKEKAEQSDKLKSAFLANMSHEIRTPLNAIVGFSEMLAETELSMDENKQFRNIINQNSELLLKLINDIIEMAMIEAGEIKIKTQEILVNEIALDAYNYFALNDKFLAQKQEIDFRYQPDPLLVYYLIDTDPIRLAQILKNLIHNAFRFTKKGSVTFGHKLLDASSFEFYVEDTGIGISKEQQKFIFDKFRQVDEMSVRPYSGTGLGLSITKKLVEKLNGTITVESAPGQGTTFRIVFPVFPIIEKQKTIASVATNETIKDKPDFSNLTFLVVEDNPSSYEYLKVILKSQNCNIVAATDGNEAIEKFTENPEINIILMDLQLPKMDGFEAIRKIRKFDAQIPIIVQTAFSTNIERTKALDAGADIFLIKPIVKRELLEAISKVIHRI